jgi:hypothetical protein
MHELIITHVVPEVSGDFADSEPIEAAHTRVYRFEFENEVPVKDILHWIEQRTATTGGQLFEREATQRANSSFVPDPELERLLAEEEDLERRRREEEID